MDKLFFTKMHGASNDFIFIDLKINPAFKVTTDKVIKLCSRRNGIGADGVITIEDNADFDFKMIYYNADGSTGSLCANGARCSIKFAEITSRLRNGKARFSANGNSYSGEVVNDDLIKFNLNPPKKIKYNFKIKAFNQMITANFVDTGSPHVIIKISDVLKNSGDAKSGFTNILDMPVVSIGKEIRSNNDFKPDGTNVNFIHIVDEIIYIRTYERGVEDETFACGTGSVAAALICFVTDNLKPPIKLKTFGGDLLLVNFEVENNKVNNLSLTGPAKVVFEGSVDEKFFL
jgi:diaminopimelate epimerase